MATPEHAAAQAAVLPQPDPGLAPPPGFEEFWRKVFRSLVRTVMIWGASVQEAEDAAADALEDMLRLWPITGAPRAYANRAALSCFLKARQHNSLSDARLLVRRGRAPRAEGAEDAALAGLEEHEAVEEILRRMTAGQRAVMAMVADGLSYQEIAAAIGITEEAVRRRVADARARISTILNPDGTPRPAGAGQESTPGEEAR